LVYKFYIWVVTKSNKLVGVSNNGSIVTN